MSDDYPIAVGENGALVWDGHPSSSELAYPFREYSESWRENAKAAYLRGWRLGWETGVHQVRVQSGRMLSVTPTSPSSTPLFIPTAADLGDLQHSIPIQEAHERFATGARNAEKTGARDGFQAGRRAGVQALLARRDWERIAKQVGGYALLAGAGFVVLRGVISWWTDRGR